MLKIRFSKFDFEESLSLGECRVEHITWKIQEPRVELLKNLVACREFEMK
jgi:hypothetical protein